MKNDNENKLRQQTIKWFLFVIILFVAGILVYYTFNIPERRSPGRKIGDAINELDSGAKKAARQLEDRTPAEKLEDTVNDAKEKVNNAD